jgi:heme A synthase
VSTALRRVIYTICTLLWLSGCVWLVVHFFFPVTTDFGPAPNPLEPWLLRIHGWVAMGAVFLFGWITSEHISDKWRKPHNRVSGLSLAVFVSILTLSGYALYYTTDRLHDASGVAHEVLGALAIVFALAHWRARERSAANRRGLRSV